MSACNHEYPELCAALGRHMVGRLLKIWFNIADGLSPGQCREYRLHWAQAAGQSLAELEQKFPPIETFVPHPSASLEDYLACVERGPQVREAVCKPCQNAGRSSIPVFACNVFGECILRGVVLEKVTGTDVKLPVCLTCKVRKPPAPAIPPAYHASPRRVTEWAVGITAAPRAEPTLTRCVVSVKNAGFSPTVYAEPGTDSSALPCPVVTRPQRLGLWQNYVQTLRDLLAAHPRAEALVIFQDDVVLCQDLRSFLEHDLWPAARVGLVSLYAPEEKEVTGPPGCVPYRGDLVGLCAAVFPRSTAEWLLTSSFARPRPGQDPLKRTLIDREISQVLRKGRLPVYFYRPSLAQHIADHSTLGHGGRKQRRKRTNRLYRMSAQFPGEQTSAYSVFPRPSRRHALPAPPPRAPAGTAPAAPANPAVARPDITVVIPGYGCEDLTCRCLDALYAETRGAVREIIYVDNGSPPQTLQAVEARTGPIPLRIIKNETNLGFSRACNQGIMAADKDTHILLLNNDAFVGPGCVQKLRAWLDRLPRVACTGPITGDDGFQSIRHSKTRQLTGFRGNVEQARYDPNTARLLQSDSSVERPMVAAFCALLSRPALNQFGVLREDGALASGLGADDEWCIRVRRGGWKVLLVCSAWCVHLHKSTFRRAGFDRAAMQREAIDQLRREGLL